MTDSPKPAPPPATAPPSALDTPHEAQTPDTSQPAQPSPRTPSQGPEDAQALLAYQGPTPPLKPGESPEDWLELPHLHYIPISLARFKQAILRDPKSQKHQDLLQDFLKLLGRIYHVHYYDTLNELKEDYEYFSANTGEDARRDVPVAELERREKRFLKNFLKTMLRGNFRPFGAKEYEQAIKHNYLFDLPVEIDWKSYERKMLTNFLDHVDSSAGAAIRQDLQLQAGLRDTLQQPDAFDERVWAFFRGINRDQSSGVFLMEKLDIAVDQLLHWAIWPFQWLVEKIRGDRTSRATQAISSLKRALGSSNTPATVQPLPAADTAGESIFQRRWLKRVNLHNRPTLFRDILEVSHLQEPTLQRIICLFRLNPKGPQSWPDKIPLLGPFLRRFIPSPEAKERDWTIHIKLFNDIPLADSEMIFPEKQIHMKSFDLTVLTMTGIAGLYALFKGAQSQSSTFFVVVLSVLLAYTIKLILGYRRVRARYLARVTHTLYHKNLDNDVGVLEYLVDSLEEQDFKEAILVYFILWREEQALSIAELDAKVEQFLAAQFDDTQVDFEVLDALQKVLEHPQHTSFHHLPLVQSIQSPDGTTRYQARPLHEALRIMDDQWDNLYTLPSLEQPRVG